jgi:dethiobiotin synthetase
VPLTRQTLFIDLFARWQAPVIVCARTTLGTINHTLLSIAALRQAGCRIFGVAFIGTANTDSEDIIGELGQTRRLGRLDIVTPLTGETLDAGFRRGFDADAIRRELAP